MRLYLVRHGETHANVAEAVEELSQADPAISARVAAGRLKIVGAFYDESNGQITLQAESGVGADLDAAQIVDVPTE